MTPGGMNVKECRDLVMVFALPVKHLPISYRPFAYRSSGLGSEFRLRAPIKHDLVATLVDHSGHFQPFEYVKTGCDRGQAAVSQALRFVFEYTLSKGATLRREPDERYRASRFAVPFKLTVDIASILAVGRRKKSHSSSEQAADSIATTPPQVCAEGRPEPTYKKNRCTRSKGHRFDRHYRRIGQTLENLKRRRKR